MSTNLIILITIAAALAVFTALFLVMRALAKRKVNVTGVLSTVDTGIDYAQSIAGAVSPYLPRIADDVISFVLKVAQQAVTHCEATYKAAIATGADATDTRSAEAASLIKSAMALQGIEETDDIDKLISTVIPLLVLALPKTHDSIPETESVVDTNAADQAETETAEVTETTKSEAIPNVKSDDDQATAAAVPVPDGAVQ